MTDFTISSICDRHIRKQSLAADKTLPYSLGYGVGYFTQLVRVLYLGCTIYLCFFFAFSHSTSFDSFSHFANFFHCLLPLMSDRTRDTFF